MLGAGGGGLSVGDALAGLRSISYLSRTAGFTAWNLFFIGLADIREADGAAMMVSYGSVEFMGTRISG